MAHRYTLIRGIFRSLMRERRAWPVGSDEYDWRTRACRKYVWTIRGIPPVCWPELEKYHAN